MTEPHRGKPSVGRDGEGLFAERQGGTTELAQGLQYGVREGGDGDEICMDAEVLFDYLDHQSRSLRDFIRSARGG